jgi:hypothetical protein
MENTNGKAQPEVTVEALIDGNEAAKILHIHPVTLAEMARGTYPGDQGRARVAVPPLQSAALGG